jgi:hypothetical protein
MGHIRNNNIKTCNGDLLLLTFKIADFLTNSAYACVTVEQYAVFLSDVRIFREPLLYFGTTNGFLWYTLEQLTPSVQNV